MFLKHLKVQVMTTILDAKTQLLCLIRTSTTTNLKKKSIDLFAVAAVLNQRKLLND